MQTNRLVLVLTCALILFHQHLVDGQLFGVNVKDEITESASSIKDKVKESTSSVLGEVKESAGEVKNAMSSKSQEKIEEIVGNIGKTANDASKTVQNAAAKIGNATIFEVNDCFGLGSILSGQIESLLKKDENTTKAQNTHFYLMSRKKPQKVEVMIGKQFGLEWTDFQVNRNTVLIVHGFLSNGNETWITDMAKAFINFADLNVIAVDWSDGGDTYNYLKAVVNTQTTGSHIATLFGQIANYTKEHGGPRKEDWGSIHCIGHSLGAHICGYAANEIKRRGAEWTIRRITGLDPAQPCFKTTDLSLKLDKNDAAFVDVIHTNGRFLLDLGLGLPQQLGHIDFFPNGGKIQPGCELTGFTIPVLSIPREVISKAICSHGRSYLYFTESVNHALAKNCTFWSHPWDRTYRNIDKILTSDCKTGMCTELGINSDKYHYRGSFFTLTSASQPYCRPSYWNAEEVKELLKEDFKETLDD